MVDFLSPSDTIRHLTLCDGNHAFLFGKSPDDKLQQGTFDGKGKIWNIWAINEL